MKRIPLSMLTHIIERRNLRLAFIQSISIPLMQLVVAIFLAAIIFFVTSNDYLEEISIGNIYVISHCNDNDVCANKKII